jgi:hypothetical protein
MSTIMHVLVSKNLVTQTVECSVTMEAPSDRDPLGFRRVYTEILAGRDTFSDEMKALVVQIWRVHYSPPNEIVYPPLVRLDRPGYRGWSMTGAIS